MLPPQPRWMPQSTGWPNTAAPAAPAVAISQPQVSEAVAQDRDTDSLDDFFNDFVLSLDMPLQNDPIMVSLLFDGDQPSHSFSLHALSLAHISYLQQTCVRHLTAQGADRIFLHEKEDLVYEACPGAYTTKSLVHESIDLQDLSR